MLEGKKDTIKLIIAIVTFIILLGLVGICMLKYEVEGETNMPFKLSKIIVIGTAEGVEKENQETNWNFIVTQSNDLHFYIDQNEEKAEEDLLIKNVKISNIQITKAPKKGIVKTYMPNSEAGRKFVYDEQYLVEDKLEYKGASQSSSTNLQVGSKGGEVLIRFSNEIGNYTPNEDEEIIHDGTMLNKIGATKEEIEFEVSFDFTIETTKSKYQANIKMQLPTGNLGEEAKCELEKTDMSDIVFKRVK